MCIQSQRHLSETSSGCMFFASSVLHLYISCSRRCNFLHLLVCICESLVQYLCGVFYASVNLFCLPHVFFFQLCISVCLLFHVFSICAFCCLYTCMILFLPVHILLLTVYILFYLMSIVLSQRFHVSLFQTLYFQCLLGVLFTILYSLLVVDRLSTTHSLFLSALFEASPSRLTCYFTFFLYLFQLPKRECLIKV